MYVLISFRYGDWYTVLQRRIFKTDKVETVYDYDLEGTCFVIHSRDSRYIDEWVKQDDHYYVNQSASSPDIQSLRDLREWSANNFQCCKICLERHEDSLRRHNQLIERHGRLRGMELFGGAWDVSFDDVVLVLLVEL